MSFQDRETFDKFHKLVRTTILAAAPDQPTFERAKAYFDSKWSYAYTARIAASLSASLFTVGCMARLASCIRQYTELFYEELANPLKKPTSTNTPYATA